MSLVARLQRRPFLWSIVLSTCSLLALQMAAVFYRQGSRGPGSAAALIGLGLLVFQMVALLPALTRNALRDSRLGVLFRVSSGGVLHVVAILLLALAAINTGNNLLYLLLALMIAAVAVSGLMARVNLAGLNLSLDYQDAIFAQEYTPYRLSLKNAKRWLPTFSIGVEWELVNAAARPTRRGERKWRPRGGGPTERLKTGAYVAYLSPGGTEVRACPMRFPRRGVYAIETVDLVTGFPFGFFQRGRRLPSSGRLVVYPAPLDRVELEGFLEGQWETASQLKRGSGIDLYALRPYQSGEDFRHIDWKVTARAGYPVAREFCREERGRLVILFDEVVEGDADDWADRFERGVSLLATLAIEFHQAGRTIRLALSHTDGVAAREPEGLAAALERLAVAMPRSATATAGPHPFDDPAVIPDLVGGGGLVVLCGFRPARAFPRLGPHLDSYLDLGRR